LKAELEGNLIDLTSDAEEEERKANEKAKKKARKKARKQAEQDAKEKEAQAERDAKRAKRLEREAQDYLLDIAALADVTLDFEMVRRLDLRIKRELKEYSYDALKNIYIERISFALVYRCPPSNQMKRAEEILGKHQGDLDTFNARVAFYKTHTYAELEKTDIYKRKDKKDL
jgi:hypothetical protein